MERTAFTELKRWKERPNRKPLIIQGARQVGKTWLMREFGKNFYRTTAYLNFADTPQAASLFEGRYDVSSIIQGIEILCNCEIQAEDTLIILDEIQECERALNSLKFLRENAPQYHIMAAGSLLGVAVRHRRMSFPVGQVDILNLRPLSFHEFLQALGENQIIKALATRQTAMLPLMHDTLVSRLKEYMYVGGMPEVVKAYVDTRSFTGARRLQLQIIQGYENDFAKYTEPKNVPRIHAVWKSIPVQLAKDNRKFVYKHLGEGARAREYESAVEWLIICGLLHRVNRVNKPGIPLSAYEHPNSFKLYTLDCGLLGALSRLDEKALITGNSVFEEFKGALTEQYVFQELLCSTDCYLAYWEPESGTAELDFIAQRGNDVIPIEVKAGINLRARSLASYRNRYAPPYAIRTSLAGYEVNAGLFNIPLYALVPFFPPA